jgi:hypothetical protein
LEEELDRETVARADTLRQAIMTELDL